MTSFENTFNWLNTAKPQETPSIDTVSKWIIEELEEFKEALQSNNYEEKLDAIGDAQVFLGNIPYFYNLNLNDLQDRLEAIQKSNWTKFCITEQEAIDTVEAYRNGTHPNKKGESIDTYYTQTGKYFVIYKTSDNKIMKSINFKDTDKFLITFTEKEAFKNFVQTNYDLKSNK
jgi:NTP pyrophosphatase (non-canonical NTP hydrolase)